MRAALRSWGLILAGLAFGAAAAQAADDAPPAAEAPPSIADLIERVQPSVVVIRVEGRDGKQEGLGTGFVVRGDGLIATNLHVIGEARPIRVETLDGQRHDVTEVVASDRALDLALVRINARDLPALELGDSDQVRQGEAVVALGNPQGLEHSVVQGVISGSRKVDGLPLLQVAIPIEPGNSGGPLIDLKGRVLGVMTMKSAVTDNLGFAVSINALKPLLEKPNPVPMERWLTIGALDPRKWEPVFGATWRQRAGRLQVDGLGRGFGGRSLCYWKGEVPERPVELGVWVRLDDEAGAAGLAFCGDGGDVHYGFYPTGGRLRLTRFDGPDVYSWTVLRELASPHYRGGQWNYLKVRLEPDRLICYVNDQPVIEIDEQALDDGRVGLCKFRDTAAEFRGFAVGRSLPPTALRPEVARRLDAALGPPPSDEAFSPDLVRMLFDDTSSAGRALRARAEALEAQARSLRRLAVEVHRQQVTEQLGQALLRADDEIDLLRAALLVARLDNEDLDVDAYLGEVGQMVDEIRGKLPDDATEADRRRALEQYLYADNGFHGSRRDYYNRSNSYLNEVIDDREGLPITLSILYLELARRLDLTVRGIGLPGHFIVRYEPPKGKPVYLDPYDAARELDQAALARLVREHAGRPLVPEVDLAVASPRSIVARVLRNLLGVAADEEHVEDQLAYLDALVVVQPDAFEDRFRRAALRAMSGRLDGARADLDWLLDRLPDGPERERLVEMREALDRLDTRHLDPAQR